jgi:hypothetical protein
MEQKMDELAQEYYETHNPQIPEEIFELARRLREMDHRQAASLMLKLCWAAFGASGLSPRPSSKATFI